MSNFRTHNITAAITAIVLVIVASFGTSGRAFAADAKPAYQFELVGKPEPSAGGKSIVSVRIVHTADGKPVSGAVIFETRADMGPSGMASMTAPVKALPETPPGTYRFEIEPGMAGNWALTLAAKIQGETETARGTINLAM